MLQQVQFAVSQLLAEMEKSEGAVREAIALSIVEPQHARLSELLKEMTVHRDGLRDRINELLKT